MATAPKTISAKPEAELVPRAEDLVLNSEELRQLDLFASLKKGISVEKFPGSIVLRRFRKGDTICRQGDRGHSAYYIVRAEDAEALQRKRAGETSGTETQQPPAAGAEREPRRVATAYVLGGPKATTRFLPRLFSFRPQAEDRPQFIPNDGPADVDYDTRQAPVFDGDVFGEMSCMTLAPRSATIVVDEDCYVVEFLRNIFDQMQRDAGYRTRIDAVYKERVLSTHLRRLEFFRDMDDAQLKSLHDATDLEVVEPGTVICDEGDTADSVYIVRSGVVQVIQAAHAALGTEDIADWPAFCKSLLVEAAEADAESSRPARPSDGSKDATPSKTKPSVADILAAAKGGAGKTGSTPATQPPDSATSNATLDAVLLRATPPQPTGEPRLAVWEWLTPQVQDAVRSLASAEAADLANRELVIAALNQLIRRREFMASKDLLPVLDSPEVADTVRSFPQGSKGVKKDWSELDIRVAGTVALRAIYPATFPRRAARQGPPKILAYLTRGDCFGEMALVLGRPRQATCIAYDHPNDDPRRKPGRVELVKIGGEAFRSVIESSPQLRSSIEQLVAKRQSEITKTEEQQPWDSRHDLTETEEFRDAGLVQGQSLLLIDLDRCTRCGDCVRACVNTHQDGYSRLFLEGPRFDRFLVPSACRQCLNPSCMIGCPVGSIQRGANGQIEIRDWCIGCGLCARQCPYDSIQMHDVGLIPENAAGWSLAPVSTTAGKRWWSRRYRPSGWASGVAPFEWTLTLFEQLVACARNESWQSNTGRLVEPLCFRYTFPLNHDDAAHEHFRLFVVAQGLAVEAWLNGASVSLQQDAKQKKKGEFEARLARSQLRRSANVVALQVSPPEQTDGGVYAPQYNQMILSARLDPIPEAGSLSMTAVGEGTQLEMELVTEKAIVCDLCSQLPNQQPACVAQCPHDAAMRVNARFEFPLG